MSKTMTNMNKDEKRMMLLTCRNILRNILTSRWNACLMMRK